MHNGMVVVVFIYNVLIDNSVIWYTFCIHVCLFYFVCYNICVLYWVFVVLNLRIALKPGTHPESFVRGFIFICFSHHTLQRGEEFKINILSGLSSARQQNAKSQSYRVFFILVRIR